MDPGYAPLRFARDAFRDDARARLCRIGAWSSSLRHPGSTRPSMPERLGSGAVGAFRRWRGVGVQAWIPGSAPSLRSGFALG